jgi:alkanesulfonate monooxygenase SsuD/methylene tetrahydromethanopterin reductase-like flavin-dependent oxidoreductase (luciferase family)
MVVSVAHGLRFQVMTIPNTSWNALLGRYQTIEKLGFDIAGMADHFVDWSNPPSPWFDLWTHTAAVAAKTTRIRLSTCVAQIPLRNPAMCARQALSVEHISNGRLELGLGLGLTIDPSYGMMGIPNWDNKERVARFVEYFEIVDQLLTNEVTSYKGRFYQVNEAVMNPRPLQKPRPPIMIAAMGPVMLKKAARYADIWNSISFAEDFDDQMQETRDRIARVDEHCAAIGRDPGTLRRSYLMFDALARPSGGKIKYYESESIFTDMVERVMELGMTDIGMYYPLRDEQFPMFERIATEVIPKLRRQ